VTVVNREGVLTRAAPGAEVAAGAAGRAAMRALVSPWAGRLERYGYAVRGAVYVVVGVLALELVLEGAPGARRPAWGAMYVIGTLPLGPALLLLAAAGFACYCLWGLTRALLDPLHRGRRPADLWRRGGYLASGVAYGALVLPTLLLALGAGGDWAAQAGPLGPGQLRWASGSLWLTGAAGIWLTGAAAGDLYQAWTAAFRRELAAGRMTRAELGLVTFVARAGLTARSAVFALLGFFLLRVASSADEGRARDLGDLGVDTVVRTLMAWPAGVLPAGLLAGGLVCFGVYSLCCAYWVRLPSRDTATA
jgi:hypothetical protein